jgi:hypothetical protein
LKKQSDTACINALVELRKLLTSNRNRKVHLALSPDDEKKTLSGAMLKSKYLCLNEKTVPKIDVFNYIGTIELGYQMIKQNLIDMETFYNQFGYRVENMFDENSNMHRLIKEHINENSSYYNDLIMMRDKIEAWKVKRKYTTVVKKEENRTEEKVWYKECWVKIAVPAIAVLSLALLFGTLCKRANK